MRRQRLFLDANVLVNAKVRDLLLRLAQTGALDVRWSARVLDETRRALTRKLGLPEPAVDRLLTAMTAAFPDAQVGGYEALEVSIELPDGDDRHVLAAAATGECDMLVTQNVRDFPDDAVEPFDVLVLPIDDALGLLIRQIPDEFERIVPMLLVALRRPAVSLENFLRRLSGVAPRSSIDLGALLGDATSMELKTNVEDADDVSSSHAAVVDLVAMLMSSEPSEALLDLLAPSILSDLGCEGEDHHTVHRVLRTVLADVVANYQDWGTGSSKRLHAPNVEIVKLVRLDGGTPRIFDEPTLVQAHVFEVQFSGDRWRIAALDNPELR